MEAAFETGTYIKNYFQENRDYFEEQLLSEAVNVRDKIEEILLIGNIDLLNNAHKLVMYVMDQSDQDVRDFAKQEGIAWATHSISLTFKLEWVQAIRRTLWNLLHKFLDERHMPFEPDDFFILEKQINDQLDQFLNTFFICYSDYKDKLLEKQKELVENLSVPIIPITEDMCILPLIGILDDQRSKIIEEKVFNAIGDLHIETLIIDLSGIAEMDGNIIDHFLKMIDGTTMMGCKPVITGLRPEIVRQMVTLGISFEERALTSGTLQSAIKRYTSLG
ncbi:anti-sigma factor antagonist [Bacillus sp. FJAT-27916]|uniref:STAS domain-containing protein n=1 Tax=Bacillus sp. FJAT-27916 TaxID=1679169 RepID=UPI0006708DAC|nr:STAS domain-containing protein [Bacillus sp. FJAT-27916]KMY44832.1 anti-sigma factor antagonist [Bacillus sp. FJAT-27916]